ncbi:cytidine deaminase [Corynebacterium uterequi]|uniref:Cytidine deaminase n=1 Tax=Corynebacterium uterequi TaxID=1072256 RepID=A0A0G3HDC0_9CORY|nr:cytidine deaminase [Corynebacterium uterequi]AKK11381.1 cytidine deaminase [Corynebacterium uterequi]
MVIATPPSDAELLAAARRAAGHSYSPYSHFPVGAAIWTGTDVVTGCNVENAAYGEAICAERNAATTMVSGGVTTIDTVAVVGLKASPCYPCGACRQVLREFGCRRVIVEGPTGEPIAHDFVDILPYSFGPEALGE